MAKYNGSVELISGITQANNQDFPLMESHAIQVDDEGTRLDEVLDKVQYDARKGKRRQLGKACLWYHNFYDYGQNDDEAAAVIAQNEIVVAGGTLYAGSFTEEDKKRQLGIIAKARALNPDLKIFYYITIASWRRDGDWSHILGKGGYWDEAEASKHPGAVRIHTKWEIFQLLEYAAHIGGTKSGKREFIETYTWTDDNGVEHTEDKYVDLYEGGISLDGCFYDDAGMETEEGRINQGFPKVLREKYIQLVNYTHGKGLAAFPNQLSEDWYADTVSTANPNGLPSSIGSDDYMLLESTHSQVGFQKRPLWRHVNGTESVWNYYQNWYDKIGAKVVINDYLYGTGTGEELSDEEFYELATYLVCDSLCCKAHYIDLNGLRTWDMPAFFNELLIPEDEEYNITRVEKGHYKLCANGHTLEVIRGSNLSLGDTVNLKSLNKIFIYVDGVRVKNLFKGSSQYMYETDYRLESIEKNVEEIQTSAKSTANIYHRMMIDDWGKELVLTNYVSAQNFIKNLETTAKTGIATVDMVDYQTNSIRLTRLNVTQINAYVEVDITDKKGHTLEFGFTVDATNGYSWGFNAYEPAPVPWTYMPKSINMNGVSSYYGNNFYGCVRTVTIPEDTEDEIWKVRICFNGAVGETFGLSNFYVVDIDEYGEDVTKDWYTNLVPVLDAAVNNNDLPICYTLDKKGDYDFDITWNDPDKFANWSGLRWTFPNGTFKAGHTYEFGFDTYENNSGGANVAFRIYFPGGNKWIPKTYKIKSSIYGDDRPGFIFTVAESATGTDGYINLTNTSGNCRTSTGEYYKTSIRGMYLYDVNEENIVIRGEEPSNSFLRICRVTDEKLAKDVKLLGNALYFTDSGAIFITDFNGNRTDISCPNNGIIEDLRLLPIPTAEDEGKILQVVNGKWVVVENNPAVDPVPDNVVLFEESDEEDSVIDVESLIKNNLTLDADDEFLYLLYGEEQISKIPMAGSGNVVYCTGIRIQESDQICSIENIGALIALSVFVSPSGCTQTVRWSSSDPTVAEVFSDGSVKVVGEGTAIITAKCGKYSSSINISVKNLNVKSNIAKNASWINRNGTPWNSENSARAYSYVGSTEPFSLVDTEYAYGIPLGQGIKYTIRLNTEVAGGCYYGVQIFSSVSKTRIVDSGWRTSGTEFNYTPAEDGLYLYVNFKYGAAGSATITDEILEKLRTGFSIRRNK